MAKRKKRIVVGCSGKAGNQTGVTDGHMTEFWRLVGLKLIDGQFMDWVLENHPKIREMAGIKWWERVLEREKGYHQSFFGKKFNLSAFQAVLEKYSREEAERWQSLGLEPHFLPKISMSQGDSYPGWRVKPEDWYYKQVARGKVLRRQPDGKLKAVKEVELEGITVLVDIRLKPPYDNGKQMFKNDNLLGPVMEALRKEEKIAKYGYGPQSSRFGVSATEDLDYVGPTLKSLDGNFRLVRLETAIEFNVIPQLYPYMPRHKDGETDTWVWYEEYFGGASRRLNGGSSDCGGLANVGCRSVGDHWDGRALRPLVVLS